LLEVLVTTGPQPPDGDPCKDASLDELFDAVYDRLKAMASRQLSRGAPGTLDTTALVHELYLRIDRERELAFEHPAQFFAYAARAMRHLLADRARLRLRQKRGGDWVRTTLAPDSGDALALTGAEQALALDEALTRLEHDDARAARVVELRYFAGLPAERIADLLQLTRRTVDRDWRYARAFLLSALDG
jgi:RNA polymerase sigma factor (TIGR02999 family)